MEPPNEQKHHLPTREYTSRLFFVKRFPYMMSSNFKAVIFDLGGVLLKWDHHNLTTIAPKQFSAIMNSTAWQNLDKGKLTVKKACEHFGLLLNMKPSVIEAALEEAQLSLRVIQPLVDTIYALKVSNPELKFYVMSNVSKEHFEIVFRALDLPWHEFSDIFVSGHEGMRKPDLCFWRHVLNKIDLAPEQVIMVDDSVENICTCRSLGIHGLLVDGKQPEKAAAALYNIFQDPLPRAQRFLKYNAGNHHSVVQTQEDIDIKDNFAQLMIWELTSDADIVYIKWPTVAVQAIEGSNKARIYSTSTEGRLNLTGNGTTNSLSLTSASGEATSDNTHGLWNYFCEKPVLTTRDFPPDADTTAMAYLCIPKAYLSRATHPDIVFEKILANTDVDGVVETYFPAHDRSHIGPEVCCNVLRAFYAFGRGSDPRLVPSKAWVVDCLRNGACIDGSRYYSTPESFLYFVARLYEECGDDTLREQLEPVKESLRERINIPANPLALAMRLYACQTVGIVPNLYKRDIKELMSLQEIDGGWPAGHFCRYGRTGVMIGNRGLTTALATKIIQHEREVIQEFAE